MWWNGISTSLIKNQWALLTTSSWSRRWSTSRARMVCNCSYANASMGPVEKISPHASSWCLMSRLLLQLVLEHTKKYKTFHDFRGLVTINMRNQRWNHVSNVNIKPKTKILSWLGTVCCKMLFWQSVILFLQAFVLSLDDVSFLVRTKCIFFPTPCARFLPYIGQRSG